MSPTKALFPTSNLKFWVDIESRTLNISDVEVFSSALVILVHIVRKACDDVTGEETVGRPGKQIPDEKREQHCLVLAILRKAILLNGLAGETRVNGWMTKGTVTQAAWNETERLSQSDVNKRIKRKQEVKTKYQAITLLELVPSPILTFSKYITQLRVNRIHVSMPQYI